MSERPILFNTRMVEAILAGDKTQTRRTVNPQPVYLPLQYMWGWKQAAGGGYQITWIRTASARDAIGDHCPYGKPGDLLWVRESFRLGRAPNDDPGQGIAIFNDYPATVICHPDMDSSRYHWARVWKTMPSIHMPRWASRLTLEVTSVRVQRLQEISQADCNAEGFSSLDAFVLLWDRINGELRPSTEQGNPWSNMTWGGNPWVWAVEFRRVQP